MLGGGSGSSGTASKLIMESTRIGVYKLACTWYDDTISYRGGTMATIQITRAGNVQIGDLIIEVDDESLTTDEAVNANYDPNCQNWAQVIDLGGHADIGWLQVRFHGGDEIKISGDWDQLVWRLV